MSKSLNIGYNISYNNKVIRYSLHFLSRRKSRLLDLGLVEKAIKTGQVNKDKSRHNKVVLERYFGKINKKYVVVLVEFREYVEVKTAWCKKGK